MLDEASSIRPHEPLRRSLHLKGKRPTYVVFLSTSITFLGVRRAPLRVRKP